jgi:hypothetical protein
MKRKWFVEVVISVSLLMAGSLCATANAEEPYEIEWIRQLGDSVYDESKAVSADGLGSVYIGGRTDGSLGGPSLGSTDAFVSKFDSAGNLLWTSQHGTSATDYGYGVSADGLGNIFLSGYTYGSLGGPHAGSADAFVSKFDSAGNFVWARLTCPRKTGPS